MLLDSWKLLGCLLNVYKTCIAVAVQQYSTVERCDCVIVWVDLGWGRWSVVVVGGGWLVVGGGCLDVGLVVLVFGGVGGWCCPNFAEGLTSSISRLSLSSHSSLSTPSLLFLSPFSPLKKLSL
jgi:hypothetical protein